MGQPGLKRACDRLQLFARVPSELLQNGVAQVGGQQRQQALEAGQQVRGKVGGSKAGWPHNPDMGGGVGHRPLPVPSAGRAPGGLCGAPLPARSAAPVSRFLTLADNRCRSLDRQSGQSWWRRDQGTGAALRIPSQVSRNPLDSEAEAVPPARPSLAPVLALKLAAQASQRYALAAMS